MEDEGGGRWMDLRWGAAAMGRFCGYTKGCRRRSSACAGETRYQMDAYGVYRWLSANRHKVGKGGAVNHKEGLHSVLRGKLNRLMRQSKGYSACAGETR